MPSINRTRIDPQVQASLQKIAKKEQDSNKTINKVANFFKATHDSGTIGIKTFIDYAKALKGLTQDATPKTVQNLKKHMRSVAKDLSKAANQHQQRQINKAVKLIKDL